MVSGHRQPELAALACCKKRGLGPTCGVGVLFRYLHDDAFLAFRGNTSTFTRPVRLTSTTYFDGAPALSHAAGGYACGLATPCGRTLRSGARRRLCEPLPESSRPGAAHKARSVPRPNLPTGIDHRPARSMRADRLGLAGRGGVRSFGHRRHVDGRCWSSKDWRA